MHLELESHDFYCVLRHLIKVLIYVALRNFCFEFRNCLNKSNQNCGDEVLFGIEKVNYITLITQHVTAS